MNVADEKKSNAIRVRWLFIVAGLLLPTFVTWGYFVAMADWPAWSQKTVYLLGKSLQFALPVLALWTLSPWSGIESKGKPKMLWLGLISGLVIGVAIYVLNRCFLSPLGIMEGPALQMRAKVSDMQIDSTASFVAIAVGYSLVHSLLEEYYWRWFVFGNLSKVVNFKTALIVSSFGFMLHHILVLATYFGWTSIWTYLGSLGVATGGMIWAWLYQRSGSLAASWISHGVVDAAIFWVGFELVFR